MKPPTRRVRAGGRRGNRRCPTARSCRGHAKRWPRAAWLAAERKVQGRGERNDGRSFLLWRLRHTCAQVWCNRWSACCPCAPGRGRPTPLAASPRRATTQRMQRAVPSPGLPLRPGSHAHQTIPAITVSPTWVPRWGGGALAPFTLTRSAALTPLDTRALSRALTHLRSAPLRSAHYHGHFFPAILCSLSAEPMGRCGRARQTNAKGKR